MWFYIICALLTAVFNIRSCPDANRFNVTNSSDVGLPKNFAEISIRKFTSVLAASLLRARLL